MSLLSIVIIQSVLLLGASILFTLIGRQIEEKYEHSASLPVVYLLLFTYMGIAMALIFPPIFMVAEWVADETSESLSPSVGAIGGRAFAQPMLYLGLFLAFPGLATMAKLCFGTTFDYFLSSLYDSSLSSPMPTDYSKAKAHAKAGNITAATRQYWKYYEEDPKRPTPLFAGARYAIREKRYEPARKFYEEIRKSFDKNTGIWAEATLELAELFHYHLDSPELSRDLLVDVRRRARRFPQGRLASERLSAQLNSQKESQEPAHD